MQKPIPFWQRLANLIVSSKFFWGTVALLALQAAWIAASGHYPMAFDEDFHLGIIRLYAHHISPIWASQPAGADAFGAVARDPSYLYHFLMSFPYRVISHFAHSQSVQVLWLRAINIGLFASSLVIYRRLLLKTGASKLIVHLCLLVFVLLPVVPLLAAQINYDNLLLPAAGLALLQAIKFNESLVKTKSVNLPLLAGLLITCLLASLIKYAFLPIFLAVLVYLGLRFKQVFKNWPQLWLGVRRGMKYGRRLTSLVLITGLIISSGLFIERYGINLVRYHAVVPACDKVLSVRQCSSYGSWIRDYDFKISKLGSFHNPLVFTSDWLYGMWLRLYFSVDGPGTEYQTRGPMPVPGISAIILATISCLALVRYGKRVFRSYNTSVLELFALVIALYVSTLWLEEFKAYIHTGQPVAINGRYLLPILLPLLLIAALTLNEMMRRQYLKRLLAVLALLSLVWGGGALTYILRSNDAWYWRSQPVYDINHAAQNILGPITPGYYEPTQFLY